MRSITWRGVRGKYKMKYLKSGTATRVWMMRLLKCNSHMQQGRLRGSLMVHAVSSWIPYMYAYDADIVYSHCGLFVYAKLWNWLCFAIIRYKRMICGCCVTFCAATNRRTTTSDGCLWEKWQTFEKFVIASTISCQSGKVGEETVYIMEDYDF